MLSTIRSRTSAAWERAHEENLRNIEQLLREAPASGTLLDVGCGDGGRTHRFATAARATEMHGLEVAPGPAERARTRGIAVAEADIADRWPYADETFDVVVSNQVIEHVRASDHFVSEIARVLKRGGFAVVSTENLASWHNIAALVLGWEPFSLTNSNAKPGLGNPLAVHRPQRWSSDEPMRHARVFAYRGLRELVESQGLVVRSVAGAGYYPLTARFARLDPRHAAFLAVAASRPR